MAFGRRSGSEETRRADASLCAIEAGGLPLPAQERLARLRTGAGGAFTSDLSAAEFLLIREGGFKPLTQVMGSCFYNLGTQYMPGKPGPGYRPEGLNTPGRAGYSGFEYDNAGRQVFENATFGQVFELDAHKLAWQQARSLALGRLEQEARLAGADAVVGVHLRRGAYNWGKNLIEFVTVGTAVASERYDLGEEPVLSNLSGQDFAKLYTSGYWPVGIVADTAVVYVMTGSNQKLAASRRSPNQELQDYTQGVNHARKLAIARAGNEAQKLGAAGLVGLSIEITREETEHEGSHSRNQKDLIVTVHALGTAIVELDRPGEPPAVRMTLDAR